MTPYTDLSHPEHRAEQEEAETADLRNQLHALGIEIDAHRRAADKTQNTWAKKWPGLGSQKTYSKILKKDFAGISVEKKLPEYRAVLSAIRTDLGTTEEEPLYTDIPGTEALMLSALRLMHHEGKDRLILVLGGSGSGKTSALRVLNDEGVVGSQLINMEAEESWKSPRAALSRMLRGLGVKKTDIPSSKADMIDPADFEAQSAGALLHRSRRSAPRVWNGPELVQDHDQPDAGANHPCRDGHAFQQAACLRQ